MIKPELLERLVCPTCSRPALVADSNKLACQACGAGFPLENGIPIFTPPPGTMIPFDKFERGPDLGTTWRRANWKFLEQEAARLPEGAAILDVGAGRGDFSRVFTGRTYIALDVYPYAEVDLVADLTSCVPIRRDCLDAIVLANVLEHAADPAGLLAVLACLLKPGGLVLVTIPFLLKIHQAPHDFSRFTRFGLQNLAERCGLEVALLEGYYDPPFLLNEALQNMERFALRGWPRLRRAVGRVALAGVRLFAGLAGAAAGAGKTAAPDGEASPAPVGYHLVLRRPAAQGGQA